ncbi:glucans biosynthesis glucosyltransferase MdoH [Algisphaera agarilytica]|uniref:Glucans biosynthesis glucosyltransferase H n=1 Tax=Algisphaera agarilytica TaxID=1385975 RepID=A0A7X0LL75_9BACT|nr:glucans biosynthesis glucosyltransferase MdoH [Algisphaera agarilytica]MBB6430336.1 membrane glycosyltransferase [Algisphaera agarilytica]
MSDIVPNSPVPRMLRTTSGALFSRFSLLLATVASTYLASYAFGHVVFGDDGNGVNPVTIALWLLFCVLFLWVAQGFWTATIGLLQMLRRSPNAVFKVKVETQPWMAPEKLPRTAILMPIYNEDSIRVFAGVEAIIRSIHAQGYTSAFDHYILSDTTDPTVWLEEETQLAAILDQFADEGVDVNIYYRRRHKNKARKSGNIEDFCERFGSAYNFMLTLDADSVMDGGTIVEMVHRASAQDDIGILQVPPQPVNRNSLFARCQQYAASVYGEVFNVGFGHWTHLDGNYYGHNALIRVQPFIDHCGLPLLPGKAPLGGEILSHDFVEAALIRKAGYKVQIAFDLDGSYEECPTTLVDYAIRDQRWCQGNMQHIRLVFTRGYKWMSRIHLGMGVMSYLASPLWLAFMLLGLMAVVIAGGTAADPYEPFGPFLIGITLFAVVMAMLLIPKFYAVCLVLQRPDVMRAHGGELQAVLGAMIEVGISILIAPLMMVYHTMFVINTLIGRTVKWNAQQRDESAVGWGDAARNHWRHTVGGIVSIAVIAWLAPSLFFWALPVLVGLVVSIPVSVMLSSVGVGTWLREHRLLMIPEEHDTPKVLRLHATALERTQAVADAVADQHPMDRVVRDPAFNRFHLAALASNREPFESTVNVAAALEQAAQDGLPELERPEQVAILSNPHALRRLHHAAWV